MTPLGYSIVGATLFVLGILIVLLRKSFLFILMGLEVMLNGINVVLVGFTRVTGNLEGQGLALILIALGASEVAVGLGIAINLMRTGIGLNVDSKEDKR